MKPRCRAKFQAVLALILQNTMDRQQLEALLLQNTLDRQQLEALLLQNTLDRQQLEALQNTLDRQQLQNTMDQQLEGLLLENTMDQQQNTLTRLQQRDADIAVIQRRFPVAAIRGNWRYSMINPLREERRLDEDARVAMVTEIGALRPEVNLRPMPHVIELESTHVLYLVRMAPLSRQLRSGEWVLTPAGNFFPGLRTMVEERRIDASICRGKYVAKFGCTTTTVRQRFIALMSELRRKHFPVQSDIPFYAICISGLLAESGFLQRMEGCMRNMFDRRRRRFRQHAGGELYPGNLSSSSDTLEFVLCDEPCREIFVVMQRLAWRLDAARRWVRALVIQLDILRQEELAATDEEVPRVNVHELYIEVLQYAAASIDRDV